MNWWLVSLRSLLAIALLLASSALAHAQRPPAPRMLPKTTLAMARVTDMPRVVERFKEAALGRIFQDPQVQPLVQQLFGSVQAAWKPIEERVGLPLEEILSIPQGEICLALVALPDVRPTPLLILDAGDRVQQVRTLLSKGEGLLLERGGFKSDLTIEDQSVTVYHSPDSTEFFLLERDGTYLLTISKEVMQFLLAAWAGKAEETLADNDNFNNIMSRCAGSVDDPPHVTWFFDPIETVRQRTRNSAAAATLALLPVLGLDGLGGVGGSITLSSGDFDLVQHLHILLKHPRRGVLEAVTLASGDATPEAWVSPDCIAYLTTNWDVNQTYRVACQLYNTITSEGELEREFRARISDRLGADFEKEILPALQGRFTLMVGTHRQAQQASPATIVGLRLRDPQAFQPVFDKILHKHAAQLDKQHFGSVAYWTVRVPAPDTSDEAPARRPPQPCFGIIGNDLIISDSVLAFQDAVLTASDLTRGLANSLDYKLIASKIERQPGGDAPGLVQFSRPEEALRLVYDRVTSEDTKRRLSRRAENNDFFRSVQQAFNDNPLPPFSALSQYLAPGGGLLVNDESGLHYSTFILKRK